MRKWQVISIPGNHIVTIETEDSVNALQAAQQAIPGLEWELAMDNPFRNCLTISCKHHRTFLGYEVYDIPAPYISPAKD